MAFIFFTNAQDFFSVSLLLLLPKCNMLRLSLSFTSQFHNTKLSCFKRIWRGLGHGAWLLPFCPLKYIGFNDALILLGRPGHCDFV